MPRVVTECVNGGGATMSTPAQITICGTLEKETIAALVELAMSAGVALLLQPRLVAASPIDVIEASPSRRAPRQLPARTSSGSTEEDRVRQALRRGPLSKAELLRATKLSGYQLQQLVKQGAVVATGATARRRYALPGGAAKEAP